jgi:hypothetical protein
MSRDAIAVKCPLCRTPIAKVLLHVGKTGEKQVRLQDVIIEDNMVGLAINGRWRPAHEGRLVEWPTEEESMERITWQLRQWQRIENRGPVSINYEPVEYMCVIANLKEGMVATVTRSLSLHISQGNIRTQSTLCRWLKITYYKKSDQKNSRGKRNDTNGSWFQRARQEADNFKEEYADMHYWVKRGRYQLSPKFLALSDRGLRDISLSRKARKVETPWPLHWLGAEEEIIIKWTTELTEAGPTRPDAEVETFERFDSMAIDQARGGVGVATEQIRSALACFRGRSPAAMGRAACLDRFTTNILEQPPADAVQCENCPGKHIPGYCLEQWSLKGP